MNVYGSCYAAKNIDFFSPQFGVGHLNTGMREAFFFAMSRKFLICGLPLFFQRHLVFISRADGVHIGLAIRNGHFILCSIFGRAKA